MCCAIRKKRGVVNKKKKNKKRKKYIETKVLNLYSQETLYYNVETAEIGNIPAIWICIWKNGRDVRVSDVFFIVIPLPRRTSREKNNNSFSFHWCALCLHSISSSSSHFCCRQLTDGFHWIPFGIMGIYVRCAII